MQILIRILSASVPVYDFTAGEIVEGRFQSFQDLPSIIKDRFPLLMELVKFDDLLGTQAYLKPYSLGAAVALITADPGFGGMRFFSDLLVFNIDDHDETKEKDS